MNSTCFKFINDSSTPFYLFTWFSSRWSFTGSALKNLSESLDIFKNLMMVISDRYEMLAQSQRDLTAEQAAEKLRSLPSVHYKQQWIDFHFLLKWRQHPHASTAVVVLLPSASQQEGGGGGRGGGGKRWRKSIDFVATLLTTPAWMHLSMNSDYCCYHYRIWFNCSGVVVYWIILTLLNGDLNIRGHFFLFSNYLLTYYLYLRLKRVQQLNNSNYYMWS